MLAAGLLAGQTTSQALGCTFRSQPVVLLSEGDPHAADSRLLQVWEERDRSVFWRGDDPRESSYRDYRRKIAARKIATDPLALLRASPDFNNDLVVRNARDWIKPATCLEKLLLGTQHARMDMLETTTEFVSVILRRPRDRQLRVYFYTVNRNGIGRMSPITDRLAADRTEGWSVDLVVHNHSFYPSDDRLNGLLAPSLPDAHFQANLAKSHGLNEARITNGIHTVRMPAATFGMFRTN